MNQGRNSSDRPGAHGRGARVSPPNRYESVRREDDFEHFEYDPDFQQQLRTVETEFLPDTSKSIISENDSPDVGFRYSLNPYRGCEHGCAYCYARPSHEYLGHSAGVDFETKIYVKHAAPRLFREWLARDAWQPQSVVLSGITDCYQPAERRFRLTRQCLEVALEARQPIALITKNALVARDIDLLAEMARFQTVSVGLSITSLRPELARIMEPRTSSPVARLRTLRTLADAGIPVHAMLAPIVPGLNDSEIPALLAAVADAGAVTASYILLRLPLTVRPVFLDWLAGARPLEAGRIEGLIRGTRCGGLNSAEFGTRMRGIGPHADQIRQAFRVFARKHGLDGELPALSTEHFRPPAGRSGQLRLF